ncbi:MAG: hypothetical protein KF723_10935 [Rhizobiaceae bacterium]|nr:hypothetical protein [Rhizobiaceae bacterium]
MREPGNAWQSATVALRVESSSLRLRSAFSRLRFKAGFKANQPRVPAGSPHGGRWAGVGGGSQTSDPIGEGRQRTIRDHTGQQRWSSYAQNYNDDDGSLRSIAVTNRDGSRINEVYGGGYVKTVSVVLKGGQRFQFDLDGNRQRIFDDEGKLIHEADWSMPSTDTSPPVVPVFLQKEPPDSPRGLKLGVGWGGGAAAIGLYNWWLSSPAQEKTPVFVFRSEEYRRNESAQLLEYVGRLSKRDVEQACAKLELTQRIADEAASMHPRVNFLSDAIRGTAIHKTIKDRVAAYNDPFFRAEVSVSKSLGSETRYAERGSVRVDVMELREDTWPASMMSKPALPGLLRFGLKRALKTLRAGLAL